MLHCCTASSEMAQMADRWATKIVALPIFSDAFSKAVLESPFANLAFVLAMEVRSAQEFALKVSVGPATACRDQGRFVAVVFHVRAVLDPSFFI